MKCGSYKNNSRKPPQTPARTQADLRGGCEYRWLFARATSDNTPARACQALRVSRRG